MNWRKINRVLHRDLGYLFFGMTVIYALSGILLNHIHEWNSNYDIVLENVVLRLPENGEMTKTEAANILAQIGEGEHLKNFYFPEKGIVKIFYKNGSLVLNRTTGKGVVERLMRRPVLFELNFLHYNPGVLWKYFSDFFCVSLLIISITGLFIIKGKNGIKGRGAWLTIAGIIMPLIFLLLYL